MNIDLSLLHCNSVDDIDISGVYDIDSSYYKDTDVIRINPVDVKGKITRREDEDGELDDYIECTIKGSMIIPDSISLEELEYPFNIEYNDILDKNDKKSENILDIFAFLWENILLEVPLQFTKVSDLSKFRGDGWRLISEDDKNLENNPFEKLLKDFEKE